MAVENRADQGASPCSVAEADVYLRADLVLYQQPKARAGRIRGIQEYLTTAATTSLHYIRERKMRPRPASSPPKTAGSPSFAQAPVMVLAKRRPLWLGDDEEDKKKSAW